MDKYALRLVAARNMLAYLEKRSVPAVICGGYVRDTICRKPVRDVDLYVREGHFDKTVKLLVKEPNVLPVATEETAEYQHQSITRQHEYAIRDADVFGLETNLVNVIGLVSRADVDVKEVIMRFNLGICQAGLDLTAVRTTPAFDADVAEEMITLLRTDWGHEATMLQFIKLQAKYPWPLRVPQTVFEADDLFNTI